MMLSKQSVFDNSKETISILQNSKLSSSLRSKSSLVIETEKAKFEQSSKTLDILIKSTKQRSMRRNMVKQVNEMKKIKDLSRKREKNSPGIGMEIEESLDFGKYQVAGLQDNENNPQNTSNKHFLEDSPRRIPPTPEPNNKPLASRKTPTMLKEKYRVSNPEYKPDNIQDAILVQNEFSEEDDCFNKEEKKGDVQNHIKKVSYTKENNLNIDVNYPFRKENSALINILDEVTKQAKQKVIINRRQANHQKTNMGQQQLKPSKSVDFSNKNRSKNRRNNPSAVSKTSKNLKSSASISRLRQPTPTSVTSRKSLESIRTNLMTCHYKTMRNEMKKSIKTSRNLYKENVNLIESKTTNLNTKGPTEQNKKPKACKTPVMKEKRKAMGPKAFTRERFRF